MMEELPDMEQGHLAALLEQYNTEAAMIERIAELEAALIRVVQEDNACVDRYGRWIDSTTRAITHAPCGEQGGRWGSPQCGCAAEAEIRAARKAA